MEESGSFLTTHLDTLFIILSLLSVEDLVRVKLVCRSWYKLINDPTFLLAHCTRPSPITAFFTTNQNFPGIMGFKPFYEEEKFPNCIRRLLENQYWVVSSNHGLLCLCDKSNTHHTYVVGNPATSMWAVLNDDIPPSGFSYSGAALIFDPFVSYHFKLAVAMFKVDTDERNKHCIRFHIYSSETCSWTVSSVYAALQDPMVINFGPGDVVTYGCHPCKIGGGFVCWMDDFDFLVGYDISSDTYWKIPLPPPISDSLHTWGLESHNGDVYCIRLGSAEGRVWRLDGKNSWVLEGGAKNEGMLNSEPFAYDKVRGLYLSGEEEIMSCMLFSFQPQDWSLFVKERGFHGRTLTILDSRMKILWLLFVVEH